MNARRVGDTTRPLPTRPLPHSQTTWHHRLFAAAGTAGTIPVLCLVQLQDRPVFADDELCIARVVDPRFKRVTFDSLATVAVADVCIA